MGLIKIIENFENENKFDIIDLTDDYQLQLIDKLSNELYVHSKNSKNIQELETDLINSQGKFGFLTHTAVKIAKSKKILSEIKKPVHISIIFSLYNIKQRLLCKKESENGENLLLKKISQIQQLVKNIQNITWDIVCVDNGCPQNTGKLALEILKKENIESNVTVLFDKTSFPKTDSKLSNNHIRKLAAVEYGMRHAVQNEKMNHVVIYTDSSLFIHIGQCGLLIDPIINGELLATVGSGRESDSIIVKSQIKNVQEKLFIYFRKRLLKRLSYITDIRYGFQAYSADFLRKIFNNPIDNPQALDTELLLKADLIKRKSVQNFAISRIRPEVDISKIDEYPYLIQLKAFVRMYHSYLTPNAISHKYAYFIKALTDEDWKTLSVNVPEGIQIKPAVHFDIYDEYSVEDFQMILEKNKKQKQN